MRTVTLLPVLAVLDATSTAAQGPSEAVRLRGVTLDHWRGAGPALLRPTLRLTTYSGRGPGADLALVIFPDGISIQPPALVLGFQAGLAQPIPVGPGALLLKAGGAGIVATGISAGGGFIRLAPGAQGGLGVLIPVDQKSTLRLDVTRHVYNTVGDSRGVWSFGLGFVGGRPARRGRRDLGWGV